jgi:deoxycytidylate deaminase
MADEDYFNEAAKVAQKALCLRDKCGAVVVLNNKIIGEGFNGPAGDSATAQKCELDLLNTIKPKSDRTCCVHAEWRAVIDAVRRKGDIRGSTIYFTRVDDEGNILKSGEPYCTVCSRLALDTGIKYFALRHDTGIKLYDTDEYNDLSYKFHLPK